MQPSSSPSGIKDKYCFMQPGYGLSQNKLHVLFYSTKAWS